MNHESSLRSSSTLMTAATVILSVLAVLSGLKLAATRFPWLMAGLSKSRASSANQQLQEKFTEFCTGAIPIQVPTVTTGSKPAGTKASFAPRQAHSPSSIPWTHSVPAISSPHRSFRGSGKETPQDSVPVTISVNNDQLLSELLRVQEQVTALAIRPQAAEVSNERERISEQALPYEVDLQATSTTNHELSEKPEQFQAEHVAEVLTQVPDLELKTDPPVAQETVPLLIAPLPITGPSALALDDSPAQPEMIQTATEALELEKSRPELPIKMPDTIETNESDVAVAMPYQSSTSLFAIPVEVSPETPIPESQLSGDVSYPLSPVPADAGLTEEPPVLPEIIGRRASAEQWSRKSTEVKPGASEPWDQSPGSRVPPVPVLESAFQNDSIEIPSETERARASSEPPVPNVDAAFGIPYGNDSGFVPPQTAFPEPAEPDADPSGYVTDMGPAFDPSYSQRAVQPRRMTKPNTSKRAVLSSRTLNEARHRLAKFVRDTGRPEFDTPDWANGFSASEPVERIRNSQVIHRITSTVRFAARPKTVK